MEVRVTAVLGRTTVTTPMDSVLFPFAVSATTTIPLAAPPLYHNH